MMYITETGLACSDGFFEVKNGKIWEPVRKRYIGILVRTIPSNNYLHIDKEKKISWYKQFVKWFKEKDEVYQREHNIPPEAEGSLAETMRGLPKEDNEYTTK